MKVSDVLPNSSTCFVYDLNTTQTQKVKFCCIFYFIFLISIVVLMDTFQLSIEGQKRHPKHTTSDPTKTTRNEATNEQDKNKHWRKQLENRREFFFFRFTFCLLFLFRKGIMQAGVGKAF
jgi:hypothetical protein